MNMKKLTIALMILAAIGIFGCLSTAYAENNTWDGSESNLWSAQATGAWVMILTMPAMAVKLPA
jgi:outer membrane lipoprotein SlyB